jgi:transglutaminase-like putative cysteine protease
MRVDMTPEKIEVPGQSVQLPTETWWLDDDFILRRRQIELDGLGAVVLTRTTREEATAAPTAPARLTDIGLKTLVPLNRAIPHPYQTRAAVYRVTIKGDPDPGSALVGDAHQEVKNVKGNTLELHVHPVRPSPEKGDAEAPGAEYLGSSYFVDCLDARVRERARQAVGEEADAWQKARRIEKWVKQNMRPDNGAAFGPAGQVARELRGDCRMYALLTTAMCRAEGVPARTAVGLLYVERAARPQMGFHMWTEVWVNGRWLGLDGTLGLGGVSAAHVKIADHSWHDTRSLTPLLPVSRVLGKVAIEVVSTEAGD